ncbi:WG repeat-containing protein, partial [Lawsonibacter sp. DFI.6.74]|nr:WG repeat-containing protein [Lawsonibacter sp. DFI.6.74]
INKRWGYINKKGEVTIEPTFSYVNQFKEGISLVETKNKYGYIDKTGEFIIKPKFDIANDFSQGLAGVRLND